MLSLLRIQMPGCAMNPGTSDPGPRTGFSRRVTRLPRGCGSTSTSTRASPTGQPFAWITRRRGSSTSSTIVVSLIRNGQMPNEWCSSVPTAGHPGSWPRMREAPTTQVG